jgi:serine phosphatase RsbU (regulator of sigma subunit)
VTNAEFFKGLELKLKPTQKPAMVLLSGQQQVLFHMGPCLPVKTYEKLPAGIIGKADNSPENPEETETLTQTVTGETREYFYSLTPARMSVTMSRHRVDGPEFQIFITAPSSIMRSRLSHTAVTIIMAALLFVALLTVPAIMIFRAFYDLEKERIKALEKELKLAYDIQMSLLPSGTVRVPGLDIFGDSIPARQVGGDFFDIYPVSDHELMVTIGDVSGKGMASALMMSRVKTLISFVSRHENNPLKVLDEVNSFLVSDSDPALFSTVLLGYVDVEKSIFTYAVAGHNPPLIIRDGRVRELEGAGTVLGAFDHTLFEQKEVALQGGDVLILYTDGFTDIWNEKREKIDEAWLWESALEDPGARSEGIAQRIFTRVTEFEGDNQQYDDRTLVVIKVGAK